MALAYKGKKAATMVYFGDGATSKGDFHEAMNFAGAFKAHTVFLCQNNQWAISLPFAQQTAAETIAQKAIAYGFKGIRVDGNDIFAVYKATKEALAEAYKGNPTLIECLTYRMGDHTTSDDAGKYRSAAEVKKHEKFEPISRLRNYMIKEKIMTAAADKKLLAQAEKDVDAAVKKFEAIQPYAPEDIMNYLYQELPSELQEELEEIKADAASGEVQ
jgi:pyruvate dehydrogenase E1 component alpha subunit